MNATAAKQKILTITAQHYKRTLTFILKI